jgi:hypothetical protein
MTKISVTVDPALIEEARQLAQVRTKREAIERASKNSSVIIGSRNYKCWPARG